ncbi:hypothetical protein [Pontibacter toksunensis]|uniref:hypothetical protein n=1 Tax=Pontibacter toksunensis TaxID=1332631 RepID=UPI00366B8197
MKSITGVKHLLILCSIYAYSYQQLYPNPDNILSTDQEIVLTVTVETLADGYWF